MSVFQNIKISATIFTLSLLIVNIAYASHEPWPNFKHEHRLFQYECDLCGCSTSSGSFGFGTLSNANFVGLRYIYQSYESKNGIYVNSPKTKEYFNTVQLWAQVPVYKNFYVSATVPYQDLKRQYEDRSEHIKGIGDITAIGWYKLQFKKRRNNNSEDIDYNKNPSDTSPHSLQLGLGIKLPTGKFEESLTDRVNPGFQVGTGSFDGIVALGYSLGLDRFGVNTMATYFIKGNNKNDYQFGNQFSYALNAYYMFPFQKFNLTPFVGISGDSYGNIRQYGETLNQTDGDILNSNFGLEMTTKRLIFGANYVTPVSQNLYGGDVKSQNYVSVYLNYAL